MGCIYSYQTKEVLIPQKKKLFGVDFFGTLGPALTPGSQCVDNKKKHVHVGMPY